MGKRQRRRYRRQALADASRPRTDDELAEEFIADNHECIPTDPWAEPPDMTCQVCGRVLT
jgi:hypothetical protein